MKSNAGQLGGASWGPGRRKRPHHPSSTAPAPTRVQSVFLEYYSRYILSFVSLMQKESQICSLRIDEAAKSFMKKNSHKLVSKWPIPFLLILIGGSIFLLASFFFQ